MKKHFMIDLETMGLRPNSAIVSVGVVHFDAMHVIDRFYTPIDLASCLEAGLVQDQSTVDWWSRQSPEARAAWDVENPPTLVEALTKFSRWLQTHSSINDCCPWGNGADYDLVLLKSAFDAVGADPPWKFWNHYCFRTVKNLFPNGGAIRKGTHHNALDDAETQTLHLQQILKVNHITHIL